MSEASGGPLIRELIAVARGDVLEVGGKAVGLGELLRDGHATPDGFVVTASAFRAFLDGNGLGPIVRRALAATAAGDAPDLAALARTLQQSVASARVPAALEHALAARLARWPGAAFAVRSSAALEDGRAHSWAGQLETSLWLPADGVASGIQRAWASLFSEHALGYWRASGAAGAGELPGMAVVVQLMVRAECAGVAFSIDPVSGDAGTLLIEAVYGLGEAAVGGDVTPDLYAVDRAGGSIVRRARHRQVRQRVAADGGGTEWQPLPPVLQERPVLDAPQLEQLRRVLVALEARSGHPVDIEWAIAEGRIHLLQCRPITALAPLAAPAPQAAAAGRGPTGAAGDGPELSAIRWRFIHRRHRSPFFARLFFRGAADLVNDLGLDYRLRYVGIFLGRVLVDHGGSAALAARLHEKFESDLAWFGRAMQRCRDQHAAARELWRRLAAVDWSGASRERLACGLREYADSCALFGAFVTWPPIMEDELSRRLRAGLASRLGAGAREAREASEASDAYDVASDPVRPGSVLDERLALLEIASRLREGHDVEPGLQRHAEQFSWMKNVGYFGELHPVSHYRQEAEALAAGDPARQLEELRAAEAGKRQRFADLIERADPESELARLIELTNEMVHFRSYRAEIFYQSYVHVRQLLQAIARAVGVADEDVFFLTPDELISLLTAAAPAPVSPALIGERRAAFLYVGPDGPGYTLISGDEAVRRCPVDEDPGVTARDELRGQPAFAGRVVGRVVVVRELADLDAVQDGDVLVTHATNINFISALRKVGAVVTEEGGILCHAAVVSRELRIPAVIGTGDATKILQTGDRVEVDARAGVVRRLAPPSPVRGDERPIQESRS